MHISVAKTVVLLSGAKLVLHIPSTYFFLGLCGVILLSYF